MPTYVTLFKWTDQGIKAVKETVTRVEQASSVAEKMGGRIVSVFWTQGVYDVVTVSEWTDDDAAQAFLLQLGSVGNVRSESLRAFDRNDMQRILGKMG